MRRPGQGAAGSLGDAFIAGSTWNKPAQPLDTVVPGAGGPVPTAGTSAGVAGQSGALTGTGAVAGASAGTTGGSAAVNGLDPGVASAVGVGTTSATPAGTGALVGVAAGTDTTQVQPSATGALAGSSAGTATGSSSLAGVAQVAGSATGIAGTAGAANAVLTATGSATGAGTAAGSAGGVGGLAGSSVAVATAAAADTGLGIMVGAGTGGAGTSAGLTGRAAVIAAANGVAVATGGLSGPGAVAGAAAANAGAFASLMGIAAKTASAAGVGTASATGQASTTIAGAAAGAAGTGGALVGRGALLGGAYGYAWANPVLLGVYSGVTIPTGGAGTELFGDPMGGGGSISVIRARAMESQMVRLVFSEEPVHVSSAGRFDGLNPANYQITIASGQATAPQVVAVDTALFAAPAAALGPDPQRALDLRTDRALVSGITYRITVKNVQSRFGSLLGAPFDADFPGAAKLAVVRPPPRKVDLTDLANLPIEGVFTVGDDGDLSPEDPVSGLRKRMLRRAYTPKNGFAHLPGYGTGVRLKRNFGPAELQSMKADLRTQLLQEPEVADAAVQFQQQVPGVLVVTMTARTKRGAQVAASLQITPSGVVVP